MRASWQICFTLSLVVVFAGCGGAEQGSASEALPSETPTQDERPADPTGLAPRSEEEETARLLNELYGFNITVGTPEGVGAALVRCTARGVNDETIDGSFGLVVRDEVVLVPLARLLRGESMMVKAACCQERPATGVYAFDARSGLALLAVPGLQAPSWTGGYAELPSPAPESFTARVGFPFDVGGSMGIGTSTLAVMKEREDPLRGRRLRLDHNFRLFGAGAILMDAAGKPVGISSEWAGNNKSWAVPVAGFLGEHLHESLDDSKLFDIDELIDNAPDDRARSIMLTMRAGSEVDHRALLDIAIALEPENALAHYHRGVVLDMLGQKEDSLKALYRSLDIDDQWSESWYSLGLVQLTSGKQSVAVDSFRRSVNLDPTHADAHGMMGVAHLYTNNAHLALEPMHKAIEIEPDRMQFAMNLEMAYKQADRGDEAYRAWEAYVLAEPDDRQGHQRYCRMLAVGQQLDRLLQVSSAGLDRFGENADDLAYQAFAIAFDESGDAEEARALAARALELEPGHQVASMLLDRIR